MCYFCQTPRTEAESPHFSHVLMDSRQIHHGAAQRENCENCITVLPTYAPKGKPHLATTLKPVADVNAAADRCNEDSIDRRYCLSALNPLQFYVLMFQINSPYAFAYS